MQIYADNAATTKMSETALKAMLPFLREYYGNPSSLHAVGQRAADALDSSRNAIAGCLGCSPKEIYFTSGGSEADNQAILSAARLGEKAGKKHIISTAFEHHAVLHTLKKLEEQGFTVELLPVGEQGNITPGQVRDAIRDDTCLVTVMYANNEVGSILPIGEIGAVCRERGILFHTDAVQAVGHLPVSVTEQNVDMLSLSAHKFHGPKGVGALFVKKGILLTNLIEGGAQERGRRAGTENVPAIVGMAAALKECSAHLEEISSRVQAMRDKLIAGLSQIPHSTLNGDSKHRLPGNVNFSFEGVDGETLLVLLDSKGICASAGSACTSGSLDPSHVLLALGRPREIANSALRLTLSDYNTEEEVASIIKEVTAAVECLRDRSPTWKAKLRGTEKFILP